VVGGQRQLLACWRAGVLAGLCIASRSALLMSSRAAGRCHTRHQPQPSASQLFHSKHIEAPQLIKAHTQNAHVAQQALGSTGGAAALTCSTGLSGG
jgi:hypothetical protein